MNKSLFSILMEKARFLAFPLSWWLNLGLVRYKIKFRGDQKFNSERHQEICIRSHNLHIFKDCPGRGDRETKFKTRISRQVKALSVDSLMLSSCS